MAPSDHPPLGGQDSFFTHVETGDTGSTTESEFEVDENEESPWGGAHLPTRDRRRDPGPARSFQASASIQGRQFAEQCDTLLTHLGFTLKGRKVIREVGVEINQEAVSPKGQVVWFEYKGSVQGTRPGLRRTDTLKKAIANGALLRSLPTPAPYVVVTSHLPEAGSGAAMLRAAMDIRCFADVVCLYDPTSTARLKNW